MTIPSAQVQVSVNGGAWSSGGLPATFGQTLNFQNATTGGINAYVWELYDYPPALATPSPPAGWISIAGVLTSYAASPEQITLPVSGTTSWGKIGVRLRLNGNPLQYQDDGTLNPAFNASLTDESTMVKIPSPGLQLEGLAFNEGVQFDPGNPFRSFVSAVMRMLRLLDGSGLGQQSISGGGSITAAANTIVYVDASGGTCTVTPPTLAPKVQFGVCDGKKGGSFTSSQGANVVNSGSNLEDPNAGTGAMASNPLTLRQPGQCVIWQGDPTGNFWKIIG